MAYILAELCIEPPWPCQPNTIGGWALGFDGAKTIAERVTPSTTKVRTSDVPGAGIELFDWVGTGSPGEPESSSPGPALAHARFPRPIASVEHNARSSKVRRARVAVEIVARAIA